MIACWEPPISGSLEEGSFNNLVHGEFMDLQVVFQDFLQCTQRYGANQLSSRYIHTVACRDRKSVV